jgi:PPOX class probable F420-dependent enzyme
MADLIRAPQHPGTHPGGLERTQPEGQSGRCPPSPVARPGAHPVSGRRLPAALPAARLAARMSPVGSREVVKLPRAGSLDEIRSSKRALLVTYRRDRTPVPTPVWAAESGGRLYVRSERGSGKVKRLRRDSRMLVAPCTVRGKPLGPPLEAIAKVLPAAEEPSAERALLGRYGAGRALFEWAMDLMRVDMCYLEITPQAWSELQTASESQPR